MSRKNGPFAAFIVVAKKKYIISVWLDTVHARKAICSQFNCLIKGDFLVRVILRLFYGKINNKDRSLMKLCLELWKFKEVKKVVACKLFEILNFKNSFKVFKVV